jgi:hypothetical protein
MLQNTSNKTLFFIVILFLILSGYKAFAGTGTDSMQFLNIKPSARAASLGDGFVSIANDVNAVFYNPAGLVQADNMELSFMHMAYLADSSYEFGAVVFPLGEKIGLGGYFVYLNYGSIPRTTENLAGDYLGSAASFVPYDLAGAISIGYRLNSSINLGVNIKIAVSDIDGNSLSAFMGDAGVLVNLSEEINAGVVLYNLGAGSPLAGRAGASTKLALAEKDYLTIGAGVNYSKESGALTGSIGAEYFDRSMFCLRVGYGTAEADGINIGVGTRQDFGDITGMLDYNITMLGDLGSTHRISLGVKFGGENSGRNKNKSNNTKGKIAPVKRLGQ